MVITNKRAFAELLIELCESAGMPERGRQAALVRYMKSKGHQISQPAVKKWFDGESLPEVDKAIDLAKLFSVSIDDLFAGKKNLSSTTPSSIAQSGSSNLNQGQWPFENRISPEQYSSLTSEQRNKVEARINLYLEDNAVKSHTSGKKQATN